MWHLFPSNLWKENKSWGLIIAKLKEKSSWELLRAHLPYILFKFTPLLTEINAYLIASFGKVNQQLKRVQPFVSHLPLTWKTPPLSCPVFPDQTNVQLHMLIDVLCLPKMCFDHLGHILSGPPEAVSQVHLLNLGKINFLFFEMEFRSCYPGWSAMVQSRLTAAPASWVQAILLPQPPE